MRHSAQKILKSSSDLRAAAGTIFCTPHFSDETYAPLPISYEVANDKIGRVSWWFDDFVVPDFLGGQTTPTEVD